MSEESGDDLGSVAMPGFIDILSSVITVFMFFMLITSAVMFFMSIEMKKNAANQSRKETETQVSEEIQKAVTQVQKGEITLKDLAEKVEQIKNEQPPTTPDPNKIDTGVKSPDQNQAVNQSASAEIANQQQSRSTFSKSTSQKVSEDPAKKAITIVFTDRAISITDDTTKSIAAYVSSVKADAGGKPVNVDIDIPDNPQAATMDVSREIGLGRMLNVRNVLLANKLPSTGISVHTIQAPPIDNSYDWVRIHVR